MEAEAGGAIDSLPPEVLQHLFSFLDTKALCAVGDVCRAWRALSAPLWRRRKVELDELGMKCVLDLAPELGTLHYFGSNSDAFWDDFPHFHAECLCHPSGPTCVSVRHLGLASPDEVSTALLRLYSATAETLALPAFTPEILRAVSEARSLRELRVLSSRMISVTEADVAAALLGCASLTDLDFSQFSVIYLVFDGYGPDDSIPLSKLTELFVDARGASLRRLAASLDYPLDDAVLDKVAAKCPGLESLEIEQSDAPRLLPFLPQLREVVLRPSLRSPAIEATADLLAAWHAAPDHAKPLAKVERLGLDLHYTSVAPHGFDYAVTVVRLCSRLRTLRLTVEEQNLVQVRRLAEAAAAGVTRFEVEISRRRVETKKPIAEALLGALPNLTAVTVGSERYTRASLKAAASSSG